MAHDDTITKPGRLKNRPDFLAVQKGKRLRGPYFLLETLDRGDPTLPPRIGFTVTRKQGNAVERNRMRRRLKEAVRHMAGVPFKAGHDYVVVARRDTLSASFDSLIKALEKRVDESTSKMHPKRTQQRHARAEAIPGAPDNIRAPGTFEPGHQE